MSNYSELMSLLNRSVTPDFATRVSWLLDLADALEDVAFDGVEEVIETARKEALGLLAAEIQRKVTEVAR